VLFTLSLIYIHLYVTTIVVLFYLFTNVLPIQFLTKQTISWFLIFIKKYTTFQTYFFSLFLCLSGLPPVGLFFIKFNILSFIMSNTHIVCMFFLYIAFLVNMFFYLQLFNFRNFRLNISVNINNIIFSYFYKNNFFNITNFSFNTFFFSFFSILFILLSFFFLFFFSDFFFIYQQFIVNICQQ